MNEINKRLDFIQSFVIFHCQNSKVSRSETKRSDKKLRGKNLDLEHDCALCTEEFKSEEDLRMHIKMHHHFPCRFCSKTFLGIKFLESHLKVCNEKIENENIKQLRLIFKFLNLEGTIMEFFIMTFEGTLLE